MSYLSQIETIINGLKEIDQDAALLNAKKQASRHELNLFINRHYSFEREGNYGLLIRGLIVRGSVVKYEHDEGVKFIFGMHEILKAVLPPTSILAE